MLIGCIGVPASGKTTVAAEVFVACKKAGINAEFVVEVARQHIAALRKSGQPVVLTDDDQRQIAAAQLAAESLMDAPQTLTIADSSPLNAWLYMSPMAQEAFEGEIEAIARRYDVLIHVTAVQEMDAQAASDVNRVHGPAEVSALQAQERRLMRLIESTGVEVLSHRRGLSVDHLVFYVVDRFLGQP